MNVAHINLHRVVVSCMFLKSISPWLSLLLFQVVLVLDSTHSLYGQVRELSINKLCFLVCFFYTVCNAIVNACLRQYFGKMGEFCFGNHGLQKSDVRSVYFFKTLLMTRIWILSQDCPFPEGLTVVSKHRCSLIFPASKFWGPKRDKRLFFVLL